MNRWPRSITGLLVAWMVAWALPAAGQPSTRVRMLVDFESPEAIRLSPGQATSHLAPTANGHTLQISTQADAHFPRVRITPAAGGSWDLSAVDSVQADVFNPQDVPVRVLMSVDGPRADGQHDCSVSSVTVAPRTRATLDAPLGIWHGESRPLDAAQVASITVLLDRPGRGHRFYVDNIRALPPGFRVLDELAGNEFFQQLEPTLGRGINLSNMLEAPREGDWGPRLEEHYFEVIRAAGFDAVRIPVRWSAHAGQQPPYAIDAEFFDRVEWAVRQAQSHDLQTVLSMHHYEELFDRPEEHRARFLALWGQIAARFRNDPPGLCLELLNEPHGRLDAHLWNRLLAEALAVVRQTNPTRKVVIGPAEFNGIDALPGLVLPAGDGNLIVTVHYYQPMTFTHQGATWLGGQAQDWLGTTWLGTPREQRAVIRDLDRALAWSVEHKLPIYLGEFGAYRKADLASRVRWTRFVADEAVKRRMSFAYWDFCAEFAAYDRHEDRWINPLKDALLPPAE